MTARDMSGINYSRDHSTAVYIKDLCKRYGSSNKDNELVLNKFCMAVKKGSIYGFLGASGCGKTTVLSCVVGLRKWDSGQVLVFGREPRSKDSGIPGKTLGYMPQDLALHNQLSIMETLRFYGRLYNMPDAMIKKQWQVLNVLLNLSSDGSELIGDLSGGQKRRTSLAVAMIHSPQLLVLDEPTVGLDPVLREKIWNHLHQISDILGTTIIVTTHYIEEARYSDIIGFMRRGRMLVEECPRELMTHFESNMLEEAVMKICRLDQVEATARKFKGDLKQINKLKFSLKQKKKQSAHRDKLDEFGEMSSCDIENGYHESQSRKKKDDLACSIFLQSLRKTCGFTWMIFLIFFRYPVFLIMIVMMPAIQGTITLWTVGSKPIGLPFGIVNNEVNDWITTCKSTKTQTYIENELGCPVSSDMDLNILHCQYLNQLKKDNLVDLIVFNTEKEARVQVEMGNSWGYMVIPGNFSLCFSDLLLAKQYATNESIEGSRIHIYLDFSQSISSFFITRHLFTSYSNYMREIAKSCSIDEKAVEVPFNFGKPIYGDNEDNYTAFVMPGLLMFTVFGIACSLSGLLLIDDRKQGTLSRATVAGLSCSNVILSHLIVQGVLTMAQLAIWNIALYFLFSIHFSGQVWLYVLICVICGLSGSAWGIFVGLIVSTEVEALYIGAAFSHILVFCCGVLWPTEAMTDFWQAVGRILPTYLPTQSLRSVIVRGLGVGHQLVWPGILMSVFWTVGFAFFSVILYRKKI